MRTSGKDAGARFASRQEMWATILVQSARAAFVAAHGTP
ncbi:MAG: hypothetical protein OJF50_001317 [Nitrospira sp.]|nr:hypothetical protein [Nitrospira sp.]